MTRPFDKHLDNDELDRLVSLQRTSVSGSEQLSEPALREARRHVESCQECSRKLQVHKSVQREILRMRAPNPSPPTPECLGDAKWLEVTAGLLPEAKTRELMKHAAQCGHCGPLLKNAAETLADEVTPSEETLLASLGSARPEWQRNMASTLRTNVLERQQKSSRWRAIFAWPTPMYTFAGIAAVVLFAWIGLRTLRPPSAEQLLAQAYTERRTLEVRISGAKYAPMRVERSASGSNLDKSSSLLKAEALISDKLSKNPSDPEWLQARARADLLDGNYESAIKSLQRALERQPDSPSLLTDLGSAYFLRAESADRAIDYGYAIESLGKALAQSPDDPIALFNRALACERMFLYSQAVDDWEHYLRLDPQGGWADEARNRLAALKEKVDQHQKSLAQPLLGPEEIARAGTNDSDLRAKIDSRIEEYLHVAVAEWLPTAYPTQSSGTLLTGETQTALAVLAVIAEKQHNDSWLTRLLNSSRGARFPSAVQTLAAAVRSDDSGDYSSARNAAHQAARLFRSAGNPEGEMRAQAEEVYSDHLLYEGRQCMSLARSLNQRLGPRGYAWLQAEMSLEESNCAGLLGDLGTTQAAVGRGTNQAKIHNYYTLFLRGLGFEADAAASMGDSKTGFSLALEGLRFFWSNPVEIMEGYNFYTDLDTAADNLRLCNLQVALWRQATAVIDAHPDVLQRAMAHRWYGNSAYLANMPTLAVEEFTKASALFGAAPKTAATTRDRMDAEIWLARIETRQGDVEQAAARLQQIQPVLEGVPSFAPEIGFYSTQAEINMRRADLSATESSFRSAIFLAEWALNSFRSQTERRQWAEQSRSAYRNLVEWKLRQGEGSLALELWEWYRGAELRASQLPTVLPQGNMDISTPPDAQAAPSLPAPSVVANRLPYFSDETVIAYATFPDGIAIWSFDDRGIFSRWISLPLPKVQELAIQFHRLCSSPYSDLFVLRTTARSLYDLLIAPIEDRLTAGRTLVFEPDELLVGIPFAALVNREEHYLAERNIVEQSPGLYQAMHLRSPRTIDPETPTLVVSVPVAAEEGLAPLADAENEAQTVAESFRSPRWLKGPEASLSAIRQQLRGVSVFHFAGHAVASPGRNGLVLAEQDGRTQRARLFSTESLRPRDTAELQLAVLSACQTQTVTDAGASGNEGLAQALLSAGVPHVLASRCNVDSEATSLLMAQFYTHLLSGQNVAGAMRAAQLQVAGLPGFAHPYYWAAFGVNGI